MGGRNGERDIGRGIKGGGREREREREREGEKPSKRGKERVRKKHKIKSVSEQEDILIFLLPHFNMLFC